MSTSPTVSTVDRFRASFLCRPQKWRKGVALDSQAGHGQAASTWEFPNRKAVVQEVLAKGVEANYSEPSNDSRTRHP